jgi:uncharacterized protein (TIGR03382 family)
MACTFDSESGMSYCDPPPDTTDGFCAPPYWNDGFGVSRGETTPGAFASATDAEGVQVTGRAPEPIGADGSAGTGSSDGGCQAAPGAPFGLPALAWFASLFLVLRRRRC